MGREARRNQAIREAADALVRDACDKGRLIEAGWLALKITAYPDGMGGEQEKQLRAAFFGGAQHLYSSIMNVLEEGQEPTEKDLTRMALIHNELGAFIQQYKREHGISDDVIAPETGTQN